MARATRPWLVSLGLAALGSAALGQGINPHHQNDITLNNGFDTYTFLSDPSVNSSFGVGPVDPNADYYWKVYPGEVLNHPTGTMEITGMKFFIADSDWTTPPDYWDIIVSPGVPSGSNPGNIEPDFLSPSAVRIFLGNSGLLNPCLLPGDPNGCGGSPCPPVPGTILGYEINIFLGTGMGDGLTITADGATPTTVTALPPSGMTIQGGLCGLGDYSFLYSRSTNEVQTDHLSTGYSAYGGFHIGNSGGMGPSGRIADPVPVTAFHSLLFFEPTLQMTTLDAAGGPGTPRDRGLGSLNRAVGTGTISLGTELYSLQGIGDVAICASSLSLLPAPGVGILGADVMIVQDLLVAQTVFGYGIGLITLENNGGDPYDNGKYTSPSTIPIPSSAVGLTLHTQCVDFNFLGTGPTQSTNVVTTHLR